MKRLIRYKKMIVSLMCAFMVISIGILSTSFDVNAQNVFNVDYPQPSTSDTQGYVSLKIRNKSTGEEYTNTFFWTIVGSMSDLVLDKDGNFDDQHYSSVPVQMKLTISSDVIRFDPLYDKVTSSYCHIAQHNVAGTLRSKFSNSIGYLPYTYDYSAEGYEILNFFYGGNVGSVSLSYSLQYQSAGFSIVFSQNDHAVQLQTVIDKLILMASNDNTIISKLLEIVNNTDTIEQKLENLIDLQEQLLDEQKTSNSWLGKIWESIQEFINPKSDDEEIANDFNAESGSQKNEIDSLNEQNQTEKVEVNSAVSDVDSNINYDNMAQYGGVLATITNNEYVLQLILVVVSIAIISYVLFGKR